MTLDEIQKMSDRELDAAIIEVLGPIPNWPPNPLPISLDLCHVAEERLKEMGLGGKFVVIFEKVAHRAWCKDQATRLDYRWCKIHATARQRAEAILLAMQKQ